MEKDIAWSTFYHYSAIQDVMVNPDRFNVPPEALLGKRPIKAKKTT